MDQTVFCINESVYSDHITKRQEYFVIDVKEGQKRIKGNMGRLVWLPDICFITEEIPAIESITIDDEINDPKNDCVEVSIQFDNGDKRYTSFMTVHWLAKLLNEQQKYVLGRNLVFMEHLSKEHIEKTINGLDAQNELLEVTQKY